MNKIIIMGRITKDIELHKTQSDNAVCTFTVAVNRDFGDGVDFIYCTAWRKTAETAAKYLGKGSNVLIEGSLQSRKYKDKSGADRVAWEVQVDKLHFVDKPSGKKEEEYVGDASHFTPFSEIKSESEDEGIVPF